MDKKIRVAAVNYLNTKPLVFGFEDGRMAEQAELSFDYPANVASMLMNNQADVGLVPVAVIPKIAQPYIISDFCIGAIKEVASVCVFSDVPLKEIAKLYLDYQSKTSVGLLKILLKSHWNISPELIPALPGYEENIHGHTAGLVIGDRALIQRQRSKHIYDLAAAWIEMTNLPFVFAAWVANKELPFTFLSSFNSATGNGLQHLDEIVAKNSFKAYDLLKYYSENISYGLDSKKRQGMKLFLNFLSADK